MVIEVEKWILCGLPLRTLWVLDCNIYIYAGHVISYLTVDVDCRICSYAKTQALIRSTATKLVEMMT